MSSKKFQKMTLKKGTLGAKNDLSYDLDLKRGDLDLIFYHLSFETMILI
jgi:hypothetical protein